nr:uncharacterized protein LOC109174906 [Ipomoea batatas]GMC76336.1 uncharacterized protein LOC109174906 [Ipomoea batatas]GME02840.1 uncharacterized protein LOC109174906 [Ipomoea batatas]
MALMKLSLVLLLACCTLPIQSVVAETICENLPTSVCAFSVSSSGKRCVIEDSVLVDGKVDYKCKTSEVVVGSSTSEEYLETDECVKACGVSRKSVGMSSDALLDSTFTGKLCSHACYNKCPNLVDLYSNVAAGEGVYLPDFCEKRRSGGSRRAMAELQSGSGSALAPEAAEAPRRAMAEEELLNLDADTPTPSPF